MCPYLGHAYSSSKIFFYYNKHQCLFPPHSVWASWTWAASHSSLHPLCLDQSLCMWGVDLVFDKWMKAVQWVTLISSEWRFLRLSRACDIWLGSSSPSVFLPYCRWRHGPPCKHQVEGSSLLSTSHSVLSVGGRLMYLTAKIGMEDACCSPFGALFLPSELAEQRLSFL